MEAASFRPEEGEDPADIMADDYRHLMASEASLDDFFVQEDLGAHLETGIIDKEVAEQVLRDLGIKGLTNGDESHGIQPQ